ncbi:MAG TPA: monovalent cation:proton antiporter-2 (CPA2) family protein [Myxococcaceae bacterium]|nr:monovalent cation:proton antiporter-2 (CPA2) family protein [Myxococcaceae bacterium]
MLGTREALLFLTVVVVAVPLFKRLGLGSVLGYLVAGVLIGPHGLRLIPDVAEVGELAELGVVLLLFLIGLELQPRRLWELRKRVFGVGGAQVTLSGALLALGALALGLSWQAALVAGLGLSLSSTAFALQLLGERNELPTPRGQTAFGILLFQDLAVIPLLAVLPLLGPAGARVDTSWVPPAKALGLIVLIVLVGRTLLRPAFRLVASARSQEVFTASALLAALGTAILVSAVGLSMALGAFMAGVLLADSEYRHELEADLEPFRGLLMGLFFVSVGMSVALELLLQRPWLIAGLVVGMTALKVLSIGVLGRRVLGAWPAAWELGVLLSQGGEFAFVLFGLAVSYEILSGPLRDILVLVVSMSMALTPLLTLAYDRIVAPRLRTRDDRPYDRDVEQDTPVIIAGFGRFGQVVGRVLRARRIPFTAMDADPAQIDFLQRFGNKVFYGDASRLDLLRAARADRARLFVLAIDEVQASLRTAREVQEHFPHLVIFARARNRAHAYQLMELGIQHVVRETFLSSLELTGDVLQELGFSYSESRATLDRFREHDEQLLQESFQYQRDEKKLIEIAERSRRELESLFARDAGEERKSA